MFIRRRIRDTGTLKAAVVGAGAFGRHHASKYRNIDGVDLFAIADPSAEVRRASHTAHGVPAVADWRDLLGRVDLVSICSPAVTHAAIVRAFLNSGAHVLVEKPIATDLRQADELIALAAASNLTLTVGHQERFVFARTGLLDHDRVPRQIECWRTGPWTGRGADVSVVLDLMIHDLDLVHRLVPGDIAAIAADAVMSESDFADQVKAELTFANGTVARLETSRISPQRRRGMRAVYDDGTIEIDFITRAVRNTTPRPLAAPDLGDPLGESVASFVAAVRHGTPTLVQPHEAREALKSALLIEDAAEAMALPAPMAFVPMAATA